MAHPYAHIFHAIAEGVTTFQVKADNGDYQDRTAEQMTWLIFKGQAVEPHLYRIKPPVVKIGDIEIAQSLRIMPAHGTQIYWPSFEPDTAEGVGTCQIGNYPKFEDRIFKAGMMYLSAGQAAAHAMALQVLTCWQA